MTKKTTTDNRTFRDSRERRVILKDGEACSLRRHYRNVMRELIGWLDKLAANDPERFVSITVPALTKVCKQYDPEQKGKGKPYQQSIVEKSLRALRDTRAISGWVERERNGRIVRGFIVTPHDGMFRRNPNQQRECGPVPGKNPSLLGHWKSSGPGGTVWWAGGKMQPSVVHLEVAPKKDESDL